MGWILEGIKRKKITGMKNIFIVLLIVAVVILLLLRKCESGSGNVVVSEKHDTVWVEVKKDTAYIPKPYAVYLKGKEVSVFDTMYLPEIVTDSTCVAYYNTLKDYYSRIYLYSDTIKNKYGYIAINDTVTENKIAGRGTSSNFSIPEIINTITLMQPKRAAFFIGANMLGNEKDPLGGYNVNLAFKTKRDRMIEAGYNQLFGGDHYYSLGLKWKISFNNKN